MKIAPAVGVMLAVIVALVVAKECGYRVGRAEAEARQRDTRDDSTVSRLVWEARVAETALLRERDSTSRVIRALRAKIAPVLPKDTVLRIVSNTPDLSNTLDVRDSLLAIYEAGRQQDSLQLVFWKAQVSARDSVILSLQASRNSWRRAASRPSYAITDIGGGLIAGYGIAEKCSACVTAGIATVALPRLLGGLRGLVSNR